MSSDDLWVSGRSGYGRRNPATARERGRLDHPYSARALPAPPPRPKAPGLSRRSCRLYGLHAREAGQVIHREPELAASRAVGSSATAAEAVYTAQVARPRRVEDVLRRRLLPPPSAPDLQAAVRRVNEQWQLALKRSEKPPNQA